MLTRYKKNNLGELVKQADVYEFAEHSISYTMFDENAVRICKKLQNSGFEAYIVGGSVRDLLNGVTPKDYDIATDAHPNMVKKLFKHARVIGRRFKLVHVVENNIIYEVSTFRSHELGENANVYGKLDEDAMRRDFTFNSLYYDVSKEHIIDFNGGYKDIKKGVLKLIIPLDIAFKEDPVRIIRAVKYAVRSNSKISYSIKKVIKADAHLLADCSISRLSEELMKILASSSSALIINDMYKLGILKYLLPKFNDYLNIKNRSDRDSFMISLDTLDKIPIKSKACMIYWLVKDYVKSVYIIKSGVVDDIFQAIKLLLLPIILANRDILEAIKLMYSDEGIEWERHHLEDAYKTKRKLKISSLLKVKSNTIVKKKKYFNKKRNKNG